MLLCEREHHVCLECVDDILFKRSQDNTCPSCRDPISKAKTKKFRELNNFRENLKLLQKEQKAAVSSK